jgi:undecaprenyl-diphosphatase
MNLFTSLFLGLLQGLTEFLPVSSSGHLVIAQRLIPGFTQPGVMFDTILHAGTLLSIIVYFRKRIIKADRKLLILIASGTVPIFLLGITFGDLFESWFGNLKIVGFALILTGVLNYFTDRKINTKSPVRLKESLLIGIAQAFAIIPGISRSGSTIFAGTMLGLDKKRAAEFSFLLSIPAIVGANTIQIYKYGFSASVNYSHYSIGFLAAFVSGYIAIGLALKFLTQKKFTYFAIYCWIVGVLVLLLV